MQNDEMFERTVKPVLDVNENHNQRNGHFKLTTFICDVWRNSTSTILNRTTNISSVTSFGNRYITLYLNNEGANTSILGI